MARRALLSEIWWNQATSIPDDEREIAKYYTLDQSDLDLIMRQNRASNRLGLACVLATLRFPGRPLADGEVLPPGVLRFLARQIGVKGVSPCKPEAAQRHTGYLVGGTSPFGTRRDMPVYIEESILALPKILINGGRRGYLVGILPSVCVQLLAAKQVQCALAD